jgi:hypothetical protein
MHKIVWAALASSLLIAGCGTDLMVPKYSASQSKGFFYALPKADVSVEVTRRIVACKIGLYVVSDGNGNPVLDKERKIQRKPHEKFSTVSVSDPLYVLEIETTAKFESNIVADKEHGYLLDYSNSSNWLKTADISMERYSSGSLKSFNATLTDTTDKVIIGVVTLAAKVGLMGAGGIPAPINLQSIRPGDRQNSNVPELCSASVRDALKTLSEVERSRNEYVRIRTGEISTLSDVLRNSQKKEEDRKPAQIEASIRLLDAQIAAMDRTIAALKSELSDTKTLRLFDGKPKAEVGNIVFFDPVPSTWFDRQGLHCLNLFNGKKLQDELGKCMDLSGRGPDPQAAQAFVRFQSVSGALGSGSNPCEDNTSEDCIKTGIVYREPVSVLLTVSQGGDRDTVVAKAQAQAQAEAEAPTAAPAVAPTPTADRVAAAARVAAASRVAAALFNSRLPDLAAALALAPVQEVQIVAQARIAVPQLGALVYLPLHNGAFASNTLSATFAENGSLLTAKYTSAAQAEKALGTLNQSLDIVAKQQDAKRNASLNELKFETDRLKAENALIDAQTENLKKLQTLRDLRN